MANPAPLPTLIPHFGDLAVWARNTYYALGQRVLNAPNIYQCTTAGTSANVDPGPAGSGGAIADNTVVWAFQYAASPAWVTLTPYTLGQRVVNGGNTYQCVTPGTSGATGPTRTTGVIGDGTVNWVYCYNAVAEVVTPTAQVGDIGGQSGATLRAGYLNWALSKILPWIYYLRDFINNSQTWGGVQTWTLRQIFSLGMTIGDSIQSFNSPAAVTDWSLFLDGNFSNFGHVRLYYSQGRAILTLNALYTAGSPGLWSQDNDLKYSLALELDGGNHVVGLLEQDPATPNWVDSSWGRLAIFNTIGAVLVSALETGGAITADSGDITATTGNIKGLTLGATSADLVATISISRSGWDAVTALHIHSNNTRGSVAVTVAVPSANPGITLTFNGAGFQPGNCGVVCAGQWDPASTYLPVVVDTIAGNQLTIQWIGTPTANKKYIANWTIVQ